MLKLIGYSWRLVTMLLTALTLISLTLRGGWVAWDQPFVDAVLQYRAIMDPILAWISIPFPFAIPSWFGDAFLLYWLFGQAGAITNIDEDTKGWEKIAMPIFFGVAAIPIFLWAFVFERDDRKSVISEFLRIAMIELVLMSFFFVILAANFYF